MRSFFIWLAGLNRCCKQKQHLRGPKQVYRDGMDAPWKIKVYENQLGYLVSLCNRYIQSESLVWS